MIFTCECVKNDLFNLKIEAEKWNNWFILIFGAIL